MSCQVCTCGDIVGHTTTIKGTDMPNWCYQNLEVRGPSHDLDSFIDAMQVTEPDSAGVMQTSVELNQMCPVDDRTFAYKTVTTKEGKEQLIKTYATFSEDGFDGYAHCVEIWGTKWGACHIVWDGKKGKYPIRIYFESAWSPACGLIKAISSKFPTLLFGLEYTEEADFFAGCELYQNGNIINTHEIGTAESEEADAFLAEIQGKAQADNTEVSESDWETYYNMCSEAREIRDEKLLKVFAKSMNDFGKSYSSKPPKGKVKHQEPF